MFVNVAANWNAECHANEVTVQPMYGMFAIGSIYDCNQTIELVSVQYHRANSTKMKKKWIFFLFLQLIPINLR